MPDPDPSFPRDAARRAVRAGLAVLLVSIVTVLLPLLLGRNSLNKYLVAFGLLGVFIGLGWLTNGAIDLFRTRHR